MSGFCRFKAPGWEKEGWIGWEKGVELEWCRDFVVSLEFGTSGRELKRE